MTSLIISPVEVNVKGLTYRGRPVFLDLADDSKFSPSSANGGWQTVDRPKNVAATQWFDRPPWQLQFTAILDASRIDNKINKEMYNAFGGYKDWVETSCATLESWVSPVPGTIQPPVLRIQGPVPGTKLNWVLYTIEFDSAIRDTVTGKRVQQTVTLTLYEYVPPLASGYAGYYGLSQTDIYNQSFASAAAATSNTTTKPYVLKRGDTFSSISKKFGQPPNQKFINAFLSANAPIFPKGLSATQLKNLGTLYPGKTIKIPIL
jgi:hypothetical protein